MPSCGVPEAGRLDEEVVADRLQAGLVDETRERELAEHGRRGRAGNDRRDLALRIDGDRRRVLRNGDAGLHDVALRA